MNYRYKALHLFVPDVNILECNNFPCSLSSEDKSLISRYILAELLDNQSTNLKAIPHICCIPFLFTDCTLNYRLAVYNVLFLLMFRQSRSSHVVGQVGRYKMYCSHLPIPLS
jgi:hypothetical protein